MSVAICRETRNDGYRRLTKLEACRYVYVLVVKDGNILKRPEEVKMQSTYKNLRNCFPTVFAALLLTLTISAQKKDDKKLSEPPLTVSVNLLVMDADGGLVPNIKASDVKIFEDGVEQKIDELKPRGPLKYLALLFDNTGSMRPDLDKITAVSPAFSRLFFFNGSDTKITVARFVGRDNISIGQSWTSDREKIESSIDNLYTEGGKSAVLDALYLTAESFPERTDELPGQNAILLVSDCEDRDSYYTEKQTLEKLKAANAQVFVTSFSSSAIVKPKDAGYLCQSLTLETGGTAYDIGKNDISAKLLEALKLIAGEQRSQYILTYRSSNPDRKGQPRKLSVQIADGPNGKKRRGGVRYGFAAPKPRRL